MPSELLTLATSRLCLAFDPAKGAITELRGRFAEDGEYGPNLLATLGVSWQTVSNSASRTSLASCRLITASTTESEIDVVVERLGEDGDPDASIRWTLSAEHDRVAVTTRLTLLRQTTATAAVIDISTRHWMLAALFDRGVVQQVLDGSTGFASSDPLSAFYSIANGGGCLAVVPGWESQQHVLTRDESRSVTGLQLVLRGAAVTEHDWVPTNWVRESSLTSNDPISASFALYPNDLPFPTHAITSQRFDTLEDAHTHFTALYASSMATLGGYLVPGSAYPTIAMPARAYWGLHTFFDPDAWSTVGVLAHSGDLYAEREARRILERAINGILESGQIPHHFDGEEPLYVAISGAAQTGPNLFLTLASLDYATATGDTAWLRSVWPVLVRAVDWVVDFYDPERLLLKVIGPLWVDVFRREGYTFDTNAAAVHVLERVADAADYFDEPEIGARYRAVTAGIRSGLNSLWAGDHYITARGRDWDTIHDMVDAESYLAVAFGLVDAGRAATIIERMDAVPNMHPAGRGTWVSGVYYGVDNCYLENTGDSASGMGRLWWADLMARVAVGDSSTFSRMFEAVRGDLVDKTWMSERYGEHGQLMRAPGYHEYPEILDKMLREGYYGITLTLAAVTVRPMRADAFAFSTGRITLDHSSERVELLVPGDGTRRYTIGGLSAGLKYTVGNTAIPADRRGEITYQGDAGVTQLITLE